MTQNQRYENFKAHFSSEISDDLQKFVIDEALIWSRYLFVKRVTSTIQHGYCTHCKSHYMVTSSKTLKHNESWQCEKCKSLVLVKSAGRGRGKLYDKAYVIWYEKSKVNPQAIVATGYNVSRDYRDDFKGVTKFYPVARYLFEPGKATMMYRNHYYAGCFNVRAIRYEEGWSFTKEPYTVIGKNSYTGNSLQSIESIHAAVKGTSYSYSEWGKFAERNIDLIYYFATFSKYPFIEYLVKMGMKKVVECMVDGGNLFRTINHKGKTMEKILGISKKEIKEWKASGIGMNPLLLYTYKWFKREEVPVSWEVASLCGHLLDGGYSLKKIEYIRQHVDLDKIIRYSINQMNKNKKHFYVYLFCNF